MDKTLLPDEQMEAINHRLAKRSIAYLETHYSSEMAEFSSIQRIMEQLHSVIAATGSGKNRMKRIS